MSDAQHRTPASFEELYRQHTDPWNYATSTYEQRKHATTLAALPQPYYDSGLELGCSIGVFTAMLATRCKLLTAVDCSTTAVRRAQAHLADRCLLSKRRPTVVNAGRW